jgi:hypothetical protein
MDERPKWTGWRRVCSHALWPFGLQTKNELGVGSGLTLMQISVVNVLYQISLSFYRCIYYRENEEQLVRNLEEGLVLHKVVPVWYVT